MGLAVYRGTFRLDNGCHSLHCTQALINSSMNTKYGVVRL